MLAILIYKRFLQQSEPRSLIITIILIQILSSVSDFCFVMRWNLVIGINDFSWLCFSSGSLKQFFMTFNLLVPFVMVSKITPAHVEAIVFSLSASLFGVQFQVSNLMGSMWNKLFFHVETDDYSNLHKMILFQISLGFMCLLYTKLIPTWR